MSEHPRRWYFVGPSGSGKSTYAARLAGVIDAPHHELDATYHQANWTPIDRDALVAAIDAATAADRWAIDGNYRAVRARVLSRAEIVVALELPRPTVMRQETGRTLGRLVRRRVLWNGNRERLSSVVRWSSERSIFRWAWVSYHHSCRRSAWLERVTAERGVEFVRVRSHREARRLLAARTGEPATRFLR